MYSSPQGTISIAVRNESSLRPAKAGKPELSGLIDKLEASTVRHFRDEEALMERCGYPQMKMHKSVHVKLIEDLAVHKKKFLSGPRVLSQEFFDFLELWLRSHIMHIDRKYGEYLIKKMLPNEPDGRTGWRLPG